MMYLYISRSSLLVYSFDLFFQYQPNPPESTKSVAIVPSSSNQQWNIFEAE